LATELKNQDPTAPVDSTAMVGQMISLNQLDQLISIEEAVTADSTTTKAAAAKAAGTTASTTALDSTSDSTKNSLSPSTAAASTVLPFDPNTLMPIGYAATDTTGASINSSINAAPIGFSGSANKTSGGK
jgi:flagellar basal-body rod modification protein FlgD